MSRWLVEFVSEARRRRVFRTAGVYLVGVWVISQGVVELAPLFDVPPRMLRGLLIAAIAFAPVVVVLSWMFDIGRTGIVRDPNDVPREQDETHVSGMETQIGSGGGRSALAVKWNDSRGEHRVVFAEEFLIGRADDCRVRFFDPLVSRRHARVFLDAGTWTLQDLGSRNGTLVDGRRAESVVLGERCEVRVNEAGPNLRLELLQPGDLVVPADGEIQDTATVAHIRIASK